MKKLLTPFLLIVAVTGLYAQSSNRIMLQSGAVEPEANLESFIASPLPSAQEQVDGFYFRFIQFNSVPSQEQKQKISSYGIMLADYIPYKTFMAAIPVSLDKQKLRELNIRAIVAQHPIQKISASLLAGVPQHAQMAKGKADLRIQYQKSISAARAFSLASAIGAVENVQEQGRIVFIRVDEKEIQNIASLPWVFFIEPIAPPSVPDDTRGRSLHRSDAINRLDFLPGRHYDGSGTAAALADDGVVGPHIDFQGRITNHSTNAPGGTHGDMTGGILAGAGNLNPTMTGMATGTQLHVFDIGGYPQIVNAVTNNATLGTVVSSTSYSQGCNEYTVDTQFGDQTTRDNPHLLFVFSAGNNAAADCNYGAGAGWGNITGGYKQGKNVIAVANLDALEVRDNTSSRGPASDGRIKPDISANGRDQNSTNTNNTYQVGGGTSAACPGIAGISCQLIQAYKEINNASDAPTALIKACLLNSAEDIGNPGPDFTYGYGRVNALRALQTIEDGRYFAGSVSQGATNTHTINVPANVTELRVMVYWHDEGGSPGASVSLVNDIDVTVTDPSSVNWYPWVLDPTPTVAALTSNAVRGPDHLNNMEQITIENPASGTYTVNVDGFAIPAGPQEYFLVYEFRKDEITVTYPAGGEGFVPGEQELIRWDGLKGLGTFTLEYSTDAGTTWTLIANNVSATTQQYNWTVPSVITGEARVRVTRGSVSGMSPDNFSIIGLPTNIQVDWSCPDSLRLTWTGVNGAAWYEISKLGTMYMDSIGTSTTTDFIVTGLNNVSNGYWFSVRAVNANGFKGRRANAVYKAPGVVNCPLQYDVELKQIISPAAGSLQACMAGNPYDVTVEIENRGINPVSNIPVSYQINGGTIVSETYSGTLNQYQTATFTFATQATLNIPGNNSLVAWTDFPGDMNVYNDTLSHSTNIIGGAALAIPVIEDFQSFSNCAVTTDCGATICNLSNGWLNAANGSEDNIDWRTHNGATASTGTGPTVDHTLGTTAGKYIYLEASGNCNNQLAILTSPCMDLTGAVNPQLTFWYHMWGTNMGSLSVDIMANGVWNNNVIPTISGNQGNQWNLGTVNLTPYIGQNIVVRFRGITGTGFESDIALDDINILEAAAPPVANFTASANNGCIGKVIQFTDLSTNNPTSWNWSFNPSTVTFVNGTSATSQNPQVQFNAAGFYDVTLVASNAFGSDTYSQPNAVIIASPVSIPLVEDFQSGVFPPAAWNLLSAGGAYTWEEINNITGYSGNPTSAAYVNNYNYNNPGAEDILETFEFNVTNALAPQMSFDVAYVRYSSTYSDTLRIDISPDCGQTWISGVYLKGGLTLATAPDQTVNWTPAAANQWRKDTVDLVPFIGSNILVRFVNINAYGNNLFLDNINVYDVTGINSAMVSNEVSVMPNPSNGLFQVMLAPSLLRNKLSVIEIMDAEGRLIYSQPAISANTQVDIRKFAKGIYHIQVKSDATVFRQKIALY
jgi:PKD repeat protein